MREIKFRAWGGKHLTLWTEMCMLGLNQFWDRDSKYDLQQYTGLKDKNGKEIYEGDIVKVVCGCGHYENLPVEWKNGYNGYYAKAQWQHDWDNNQLELRWTERDAEIIGNIYENPDRRLF